MQRFGFEWLSSAIVTDEALLYIVKNSSQSMIICFLYITTRTKLVIKYPRRNTVLLFNVSVIKDFCYSRISSFQNLVTRISSPKIFVTKNFCSSKFLLFQNSVTRISSPEFRHQEKIFVIQEYRHSINSLSESRHQNPLKFRHQDFVTRNPSESRYQKSVTRNPVTIKIPSESRY